MSLHRARAGCPGHPSQLTGERQQRPVDDVQARVVVQAAGSLPDLPTRCRLPRAAQRHVSRVPAYRPDALERTCSGRTVCC